MSQLFLVKDTLYHIVFRTKKSEKTINQEYSTELKRYIWGIRRLNRDFLTTPNCASLASGLSACMSFGHRRLNRSRYMSYGQKQLE